jgi:aspartate racemase
VNPAIAITEIALELAGLGATVTGLPCNTAHAPAIFDVVVRNLKEAGSSLRLLNILDETVSYLQAEFGPRASVGVLGTRATHELGLYSNRLAAAGLHHIQPPSALITSVNEAIFDSTFGLKSQSTVVSSEASARLLRAIDYFDEHDADCVILGCTELPLAPLLHLNTGMPLVDATLLLARALIRHVRPAALRPLPSPLSSIPEFSTADAMTL